MKLKMAVPLLIMFIAASLAAAQTNSAPVVKTGKNWLDGNAYFSYEFDKKPKLGVAIVKIKVFSKNGARNNEYSISGKSGMVSMRAHDTGDTAFRQNKKGDYLLPVDIAMPGDWQVKITVKKKTVVVYSGDIRFDVE